MGREEGRVDMKVAGREGQGIQGREEEDKTYDRGKGKGIGRKNAREDEENKEERQDGEKEADGGGWRA